MENFEDKMAEFEKKGKSSTRGIKRIIIIGLVIFTGLYLNNLRVENLKQEQAEQDGALLMEQQTQLVVEDSLRYELARVQGELKKIKVAATRSDVLKEKIEALDITLDYNPLRIDYYQRKKDGNAILDVIENADDIDVDLRIIDVYGDDYRQAVNTIYVGKNVDEGKLKSLLLRFKRKGIQLTRAPFISGKGSEWKDNAIEIGYEPVPGTINKNAEIYIRIYSYAPDEIIKQKMADKFGAKGYQVRVYPDWKKKPSFFSDRTTILFYDKANAKKAQEMSVWLARLTGLSFSTKMGAGLGVSGEDRKNLFIIHYNGRAKG